MEILLILTAAVLLLMLVATGRTLLIRRARPSGPAPEVDRRKAQKYAEDLAQMLRFETVNRPGLSPEAQREMFSAFHGVLARQFPLVFAKLERIGGLGDALLLRWQGKNPRQGALVLMAHSDVVPATGGWQHPPFGGEIAEGCVWGRGAMDTKGSLCAILEAAETLLEEGFQPACDLYIASSNNEETMGDGAVKIRGWFLQNDVKLTIVHDEGGVIAQAPLPGLSGLFAMMGITEKGYANVRFTAASGGGHASTPPKDTPLARLAAFVHHMERRPPFKKRISRPLRLMLAAMAPHMRFGYRLVFGNLWLFAPLVLWWMPRMGATPAAMVRTTCAFTMAEGSAAANVIPETASVTANIRSISHQPMEESLAVVRQLAKRYGLETEVLYANDVSPVTNTESAEYRYLVDCVRQSFPEVAVIPYVMLGGTDARHLADLCRCTVRFNPTILSPQQYASMHGLDENLGVDALARAVDYYTRVMRHACSINMD